MSELLKRSQICIGLVAFVLLAGILISGGAVTPALAQACDKIGGKVGGAVIGGAAGSMFGKGKGRKASRIGGAVVGGTLGARRDRRAKARCLEEREVEKESRHAATA